MNERDDHFHDECGVFGVFDHGEAANIAYLGLHALQHRGQESAGIVSGDGEGLHTIINSGLVADVFGEDQLARLPGRHAIGHVRYSTSGGTGLKNAQPISVRYGGGQIAVAHNGNLTNADQLRDELEAEGSIFAGDSDTEVIVHLFARSRKTTVESRLVDALSRVEGAYSVTVLTKDQLIGVRDPHGVRPLAMGTVAGATVMASETCALHLIGARYDREVRPGEMVVIDANGIRSTQPFPAADRHACVFEHVYFSRPDSRIFGESVYAVRRELGRQLAAESPVEADVVIPVPDSGIAAAIGYAEASGITYGLGLVRSHYIGRTFIEPAQSIRHFGVKLKLAPVYEVLDGQRVVVIDDSLVRGTTSHKIIAMLRGAGAREVHMRISSPPITHSCFYGVDTPTRGELIAAHQSVDSIADFLGCDSLAYLSRDGLLEAAGGESAGFCDACFTGHYPIPIEGRPPE